MLELLENNAAVLVAIIGAVGAAIAAIVAASRGYKATPKNIPTGASSGCSSNVLAAVDHLHEDISKVVESLNTMKSQHAVMQDTLNKAYTKIDNIDVNVRVIREK